MQTNECSRCMLTTSVAGLRISENGLCDYCRAFDSDGKQWTDYARGRALFDERLRAVKGKYEFDALVGVSGGKDGAYVLYKLAVERNLKVAAVTCDNGFLTDEAKEKVRELVRKTGVYHEFIAPDFKDFYQGTLLTMCNPCVACSLGGYYLSYKKCVAMRIPFFIHGRSTYQMYRNMTPESKLRDLFVMLSASNYREYSQDTVRSCYASAFQLLKQMVGSFPVTSRQRQAVLDEFFLPPEKIPAGFMPEAFAYFLSEPYDEQLIRDTLRAELGYEAPPSHADCSVHNFANYGVSLKLGASFRRLEAATMLRWGKIDREAALEVFSEDEHDVNRNRSVFLRELSILCEHAGVTPVEIAERFPALRPML